MSERWVMTERKLIVVSEKREVHGGVIMKQDVTRIFDVGDDAPAGHEGRPYTRKMTAPPRIDMGQRIEEDAPNRMLDTGGAKKRGRRAKA